jgi:hypothetical protein
MSSQPPSGPTGMPDGSQPSQLPAPGVTRRNLLRAGGGLLAAGWLVSGTRWASTPASAATTGSAGAWTPPGVPDLPTFTGPGATPEPVPFQLNGMMAAIQRADEKRGAFWLDDMFARHGADQSGDILLSRGRAALMYTHDITTWGFAGSLSYIHNISGQDAYQIAVDQAFTEDVSRRVNWPSHLESVWVSGSVTATQRNFITYNNCAVTTLEFANSGTSAWTGTLTVTSPYANAASDDELVGSTATTGNLTTVQFRLSGSSLTPSSGTLTGTVTVSAGESASLTIIMGMITAELPDSATEYDTYRSLSASDALGQHVTIYNRWWAENIPYIDIPDSHLKKLIYYRWWDIRFNSIDAELPAYYRYPTTVEGALGYDNPITNSIPVQMDDTKWLKNPLLAYSSWLSVGATAKGSAFVDNPGGVNWHNSYNQYISRAGWDALQIHGSPEKLTRLVAGYARDDVNGQLTVFDGNNNYLIEYSEPALTGYDADALSFFYDKGAMDRTESAYVWWNAEAGRAMWTYIGDRQSANSLGDTASNVRSAILNLLWDPAAGVFKQRDAQEGYLIPWKEVDNFYPFTVGLVPATAEYLAAYSYWTQPDHFAIFPPYVSDQTDYAACIAAGNSPTLNFGGFPATAGLRFLSSTLRNYPAAGFTAHDYQRMLYWTGWLEFVGGDGAWPDSNEFLNSWNPSTEQIDYRSWIHYDFLGNYNWTIVEDVAGLRPRTDTTIELNPIDIGWDYFVLDQIPYHGHSLTIAWNRPGTAPQHGLPSGYSLYVDGHLAFTIDALSPVTWDSLTGQVSGPGTQPSGRGTALPIPAIDGVPLSLQVLEQAAKAGAGSAAWLRLKNAASGLVLAVTDMSLLDGAEVALADDNGSPSGSWRIVDLGGDAAIRNYNSGKVLAVKGDGVVQTTYDEQQATLWRITDLGNGYVRIGTSHDNRILTATGQRAELAGESGSAAQLWQVIPDPEFRLQNALSNKLLAAPMVNLAKLDAGVQASASFTFALDSVNGPLTNTTYGPEPRWTCWNSQNATDWYALAFSASTAFDRINMDFYDDFGGTQPPVNYTVQYLADGQWENVTDQASYPATPAEGFNVVSFDPVTSTAVRVVFTNRNPVAGGTYTGLISFQVFNSGSVSNGPVIQETDNGLPDHLWTMTAAANGYVTITNVDSNLNLGSADGSTVDQAQPTKAPDQQWRLIYDTNGYYMIQNAANGLLLTISGNSLSAGTAAVLESNANSDSQRWSLGTAGT